MSEILGIGKKLVAVNLPPGATEVGCVVIFHDGKEARFGVSIKAAEGFDAETVCAHLVSVLAQYGQMKIIEAVQSGKEKSGPVLVES